MITLTTIGAKSGRPRSVPLIGIPDGDELILVASNWGQERHPGWYYNLRANPRVIASMNGSKQAYMAREAAGEERARYWQKAAGVYGGYEAYKSRVGEREIPVVILSPLNQSS